MNSSYQDKIAQSIQTIAKSSDQANRILLEGDLTQENAEQLKLCMLVIQREISSSFAPLRVVNSTLFALKPKKAANDTEE